MDIERLVVTLIANTEQWTRGFGIASSALVGFAALAAETTTRLTSQAVQLAAEYEQVAIASRHTQLHTGIEAISACMHVQ